ncbi:hypothetical protein CSUB01_08409 [Colletotrichum sublineola]|uniref:Uncharacterized protein n=1 Tax=Colletotrichum sublineola TaxID=1173701 RepID=A0A066XWL4_COLSU|nr:hypothetical protein CSUB01_08409 [Colletotrichum sublineola]
MPLLVDESAANPLLCHEPAEETTTVSAHMSARIHAYDKKLAAAYNEIENPPAGLCIYIKIRPQGFNFETEDRCYHRRFHSRRLRLHNPEALPDLPFVTRLTIRSGSWGSDAVDATDIRPLSPLVPLQCLVHLPAVQEWNAPWLWERPMPTTLPSKTIREQYNWP